MQEHISPGVPPEFIPIILEMVPIAVFVVDTGRNVRLLNSAARELWGGARYVGPDDWELYKLLDYETGRSVPPADRPSARALLGIETAGALFAMEGFNGARRVIQISAAPIRDADGAIIGSVSTHADITEPHRTSAERERLVRELQEALKEIRTLSGLLPICSNCRRIRDEASEWRDLEEYVRVHTTAQFTHSMCPQCTEYLFPEERLR